MSSVAPRLSARRTLNTIFRLRFHRSTTIGTRKKSCSARMRVFTFSEIIDYFIGNSLFFFTLWAIVAGDTLGIFLLFLFEKIEHPYPPWW